MKNETFEPIIGYDNIKSELYKILQQRVDNNKVTVIISEHSIDSLREAIRDDLIPFLTAENAENEASPNILAGIARQWRDMSGTVLDLKKIPAAALQNLLKDTYEALYFYHKKSLVPKALSEILLEMDEFLYFATLLEGKEVEIDFFYYQAISSVAKALKQGFFAGKYDCVFPVLKFFDPTNAPHILDFENGRIEDLI